MRRFLKYEYGKLSYQMERRLAREIGKQHQEQINASIAVDAPTPKGNLQRFSMLLNNGISRDTALILASSKYDKL